MNVFQEGRQMVVGEVGMGLWIWECIYRQDLFCSKTKNIKTQGYVGRRHTIIQSPMIR